MKKSFAPKLSFSQCGEDLIIRFIFNLLGIKQPSYIDIGAYDPDKYNNTAIFYMDGSSGINIEPDPDQFIRFLTKRKRDINLNIAVFTKNGTKDFCIMTNKKLSRITNNQSKINDIDKSSVSFIKVKTKTIMNILNQHCKKHFPDFLTLDTEENDFEILKSIDFNIFYPYVICVETMTYSSQLGESKKIIKIINYLCSRGYFVFADTYINTIFVRKDIWYKN